MYRDIARNFQCLTQRVLSGHSDDHPTEVLAALQETQTVLSDAQRQLEASDRDYQQIAQVLDVFETCRRDLRQKLH